MTDELTTSPNVQKAVDAATAAVAPDTFDFAAAIMDRSYPEFEVPVYLDEKLVQHLLRVEEDREELYTTIANSKEPSVEQAQRLEEIEEEFEAVREQLRAQKYTVQIRGISPEAVDILDKQAQEEYPKQFEETTHAMTGATVRTEIPEPKREELLSTLLRQAHLVSVTAPNGAVDRDFSDIEKVKAMFARLPLVARVKIDQAINESTIAVDFYRELTDEVF